MRRVAVCIVTLRRPQHLRRALESVRDLRLDRAVDSEVRIIVVDNDPAGSASPVVESVFGVTGADYLVEPRRGIPYARNAAVTRAAAADFVAFLDDDEWAEPSWLDELLLVQERTGADVVAGPVIPQFDTPPPRWLEQSDYFRPLDFVNEATLDFANTGNVLISSRVLVEPAPFSARFARTGGEDTRFFLAAAQAGARISWAADARVYESVPPDRARLVWTLRREFRRGATLSMCLLELDPSPRRIAKRIGHGGARLLQGLALMGGVPVRGRTAAAMGLQRIALSFGLFFGLTGRGYDEYGNR